WSPSRFGNVSEGVESNGKRRQFELSLVYHLGRLSTPIHAGSGRQAVGAGIVIPHSPFHIPHSLPTAASPPRCGTWSRSAAQTASLAARGWPARRGLGSTERRTPPVRRCWLPSRR